MASKQWFRGGAQLDEVRRGERRDTEKKAAARFFAF